MVWQVILCGALAHAESGGWLEKNTDKGK